MLSPMSSRRQALEIRVCLQGFLYSTINLLSWYTEVKFQIMTYGLTQRRCDNTFEINFKRI